MFTEQPPEGATLSRVTVIVEDWPGLMLLGLAATESMTLLHMEGCSARALAPYWRAATSPNVAATANRSKRVAADNRLLLAFPNIGTCLLPSAVPGENLNTERRFPRRSYRGERKETKF